MELDEELLENYRLLKTEVLEMIIRQDAEDNGGDNQGLDLDDLFCILEVLAERRKARGEHRKTAEKAYEEFESYYLCCESENSESAGSAKEKKPTKFVPRWIRYGLTVAATIALVILGSVTARAFGYDIWNTFYIWTDEAFRFVSVWSGPAQESSGEQNKTQDNSLGSLVDKYNIPQEIVPMELPKGYDLLEEFNALTDTVNRYTFVFSDGQNKVLLVVSEYEKMDTVWQEKSNSVFEIREINGVAYYLLCNIDQYRITWQQGNYECFIGGDLTIEEINEIFTSIERK